MKWCQFHCQTCGAHFTALEAFDLHREGTYDPDTRRCRPLGRRKIMRRSSNVYRPIDGGCRIGKNTGAPVLGVRLWSGAE